MKVFISIGCEPGEKLDILDAAGRVIKTLEHEAANHVLDVDSGDACVMIGSRVFCRKITDVLGTEAGGIVNALHGAVGVVTGTADPAATPETAIPEPSTEAAMPAGTVDPAGSAPGAAAAT